MIFVSQKKVLVLRSDASKIFQCCQSSLQRIKSNLPSLQRSPPVQCYHAKLARSKMSQRRQDKIFTTNKYIIKTKLRNVSHLSKRLDSKNSCALIFKFSLLICSVQFLSLWKAELFAVFTPKMWHNTSL